MTKEEEKRFYVSMTDRFMSGWGRAEGRINKLVFVCNSEEEVEIVSDNAHNRTDMKYIHTYNKKPYWSGKRYLVQYKTKDDYGSWYVKNFFRRQRYEAEAL